VNDHVSFRGGWGSDGLVAAASVLAASDSIGAYVAAYLLPLRHPVPLARQMVTLSQLAPGRLILGVGVGGEDRTEVRACGVDPSTRGRRTDESLAILRGLLAGEDVSFEGEFFQLDGVSVLPTPIPPVPIIIGGRSEAALRRTARFGDGWHGIWLSASRYAEAVNGIAAAATEFKREAIPSRHGMTFWCGFAHNKEEARSRVAQDMEAVYGTPYEAFERSSPFGTPREVADVVAPYIEAGCRDLNFVPRAGSLEAGVAAVAEIRDLLVAAVVR
jgi:alkanesulfonate monooxygenase SsuD/methylene tetrahydromethanopterin reductase-like flavin-dependent oxidoreductase (luciferase family)